MGAGFVIDRSLVAELHCPAEHGRGVFQVAGIFIADPEKIIGAIVPGILLQADSQIFNSLGILAFFDMGDAQTKLFVCSQRSMRRKYKTQAGHEQTGGQAPRTGHK